MSALAILQQLRISPDFRVAEHTPTLAGQNRNSNLGSAGKSSGQTLQVNHWLLVCANKPGARPVKIDDYGKNQRDRQDQNAHGKGIPSPVQTEGVSDQHRGQQSHDGIAK
jgi:hypothetical protein